MKNSIITSKEIKKIAALARISLSKQEQERFSAEIDSILEFFKDLGNVNVGNYQTFDHYNLNKNQLRKDKSEKRPENEKEGMRKLFPKRRGDYLKVKAVLKS